MILVIFFFGIPVVLFIISSHVMKVDKKIDALQNDVDRIKERIK